MPAADIATKNIPTGSRAVPSKVMPTNSRSPGESSMETVTADRTPSISNQPKSTNGHSLQGSRLKSTDTASTVLPVTLPKTILTTTASGASNSGAVVSSVSGSGSRHLWKDQPTIGRYKLTRTLGRGNFAKVKLGEHLLTGQQVAIKVIDKTQLNLASLSKLVREVKIMKMLNHPNIVRLYEVIESERRVYLVMEYASNGEVFDYLVSNGRMKEKDARVKFRQLVSAVEYCHRKQIVHRDLKAENLLLDKDYNIKLADFGFSNFYEDTRKLDTYCGSPPYAAPELFQGQKYVGPEVDVWSLGVILYTLVSGTLPFDAQHLKELQSRVIRGKYRIPFYMSTECELLLRKLLVLSPSKRKPLKTIMTDKWLNLGFDQSILEPYIEPAPDYHDPVRLSIMQKMGYTPDEVQEALKNQAFNNLTAIYLLLGCKDCSLLSACPQNDSLVAPPQSDGESSGVAGVGVDNLSLNDGVTVTPPSRENSAVGHNNQVAKTKGVENAICNTNSRKPITYSWMKQSISAGPTPRTEATAPTTNSPAYVLPRLQLPNRWPISKGGTAEQPSTSGFDPDAATGKDSDRLLLFNGDPTDMGLHHQLSGVGGSGGRLRPSGSEAGANTMPGAATQNQPLSRAPPFSDIPHLVTGEAPAVSNIDRSSTLEEQEEPLGDQYHAEVSTSFHKQPETLASDAHGPLKITTKPAVVYRKSNAFLSWLRRVFSCHRRQEPKSSSLRTPDNAPIVRVDSRNHQFDSIQVVDILNPISRHQFTRNCPDRATVIGLPPHRLQHQANIICTKTSPVTDSRNPDSSSSSVKTSSEADTLYGSVTGTAAPKLTGGSTSSNGTLNSSIVPRISPADHSPTVDCSPVTTCQDKDKPSHQWSMRLRPGQGDVEAGKTQPETPHATLTRQNSSHATTTPSGLPSLQPHGGHFLRRLTMRFYRSLRSKR